MARSAGIRALLTVALLASLVPSIAGAPLAASAATLPVYWPVRVLPDAAGCVTEPAGMAMDASGNVYVADAGMDRVRVLSATGALVRTIGRTGSGPGRLRAPEAVAVASSGDVYVADTGNSRVSVFRPDGTFSASFGVGMLPRPSGMAIGTDGSIYVSDRSNGYVRRFSASGNWLADYTGGPGDNPGQGTPRGVAVTADTLFVVDSAHARISMFRLADNAYLGQWGPYMVGMQTFSRYNAPTGITLGPDAASVLIADTGNHRIERCDLLGNVLGQWGSPPGGSGVGQLSVPRGAVLAGDGSLFISDTGNSRISRADTSGWLAPWQGSGAGVGQLSSPQAVATDEADNVYVADTANNRIQPFSATGVPLAPIGTAGSGVGQLSAPSGVAVGTDGYLYIADTGNNRVQRYSLTGSTWSVIGAGQLSAPHGIALNPFSSEMYVADTGNNRIAAISLTDFSVRSIGTVGTGTGQLMAPEGVALDPNGRLWVADTANSRVQSFRTTDGAVLGSPIAMPPGTLAPSPKPTSLAAMGYSLAITDPDNGLVRVLDTGMRQFVRVIGDSGEVPGPLHAPVGVATPPAASAAAGPDCDKRIVVVERDTHRVQVLEKDPLPVFDVVNDAVSATAMLSMSGDNVAQSFLVRRTSTEPPTTTFSATLDGVGVGDLNSAVPVKGEGRHTLEVTAVNARGSQRVQTYPLVIDNTKPIITITGVTPNAAYASRPPAGWSVADANAVPTEYATIDGVPYSPGGPIGDGVHTLVVTAVDAAGNSATKSCVFTVDTTQPYLVTLGSTLGSGPMVGRGASFEWSPGPDLTGISGYSWVVDQNPNTLPDASVDSPEGVRKTVFDGLGPGTWYFHVRVCDGVGNWSATAHTSTTLVAPLTAEKPRLVSPQPSSARRRVVSIEGPIDVSAAGSCSTRVLAYHSEAGRWVLRRSAATQVITSSGPAHYRCSLSLAKGDWRIFAVNESPGARPLHTGFASVRVR